MNFAKEMYYKFQNNKSTFIVGGTLASTQTIPWQVSIQQFNPGGWFKSPSWQHICGGSILSPNWILTAAHCLHDSASLRVVSGSSSLSRASSTTQIRTVDLTIRHPLFNSDFVENDIALIFLSTPLLMVEKSVMSIKLPPKDAQPIDSGDALTSGWGRTFHGGPISDLLLQVTLPIVPWAECCKCYNNVSNVSITNKKICAGRLDASGFGVCQGDSGGPLVMDGFVVGVTSFGVICGSSSHPTVYTRVSAYREWIDETIDNSGKRK